MNSTLDIFKDQFAYDDKLNVNNDKEYFIMHNCIYQTAKIIIMHIIKHNLDEMVVDH